MAIAGAELLGAKGVGLDLVMVLAGETRSTQRGEASCMTMLMPASLRVGRVNLIIIVQVDALSWRCTNTQINVSIKVNQMKMQKSKSIGSIVPLEVGTSAASVSP